MGEYVVLTTLLAIGLVGPPVAGLAQERSADEIGRDLEDAQERRDRQRAALSELGDEVVRARAELVRLQRDLEQARQQLRVAEGQLALGEMALADAEVARDAAVANLDLAERMLGQAETQLAGEEADLRDQVASAYKYGAAGRGALYLEVIRQARTPNEVAVGLYQLGAIIDFQDGLVTRVEELRADRAVLRDGADRTRRDAEARELDAAATLEVVTRLREDAQRLADAIAADEARQRDVLASLEADAAEQQALVTEAEQEAAELAEELESARKRQAAVGGFVCPVTPSWFQNDWGFPRSGGRSHQGTDVFADRGTPVVAVADGTVKEVDRVDRYRPGTSAGDLGGLWVSYWTAPGEYWYFSHLGTVAEGLQPGDRVAAGDVIGTIGNSGNARTTPTHTHVGRYVDRAAVNPYPALANAC